MILKVIEILVIMIIAIFSNNYDDSDNQNDDDGKMVIPEKITNIKMTKALMTTKKNENNNICKNINTHSNGYKDENNDGDVRDNTKRNSNTTATYINDSDKRSDDDKRKEIKQQLQ